MVPKSARKLVTFLQTKQSGLSPLLIMTHDYPDPDTIASAFALKYIAEKVFNINSKIVYHGIIGRMENRAMVDILKIPMYKLKPVDLKRYENTALIDTQPAFQNNSFPKKRKATIVIDQHPSEVKPLAECAIVDLECGATSVILAQALIMFRIEIPTRVATALAYGILADTMNLYRAKRPDIIQTYLKLLPFCDLKALAHIQNPVRSRSFFKTLGLGIQNAVVRSGLITAHLGDVENPDVVSQVADFLLTYKRISRSFCTGRYKGKLHISLRMEPSNADAGNILRDIFENRGDAGGHDVIAGGSLKLGGKASQEVWAEAENELERRLLKRFRISGKREPYYPFREAPLKIKSD